MSVGSRSKSWRFDEAVPKWKLQPSNMLQTSHTTDLAYQDSARAKFSPQ